MKNSEQKIDEPRVILVNKPLTWTSFDVVKKIKYGLRVKKIGHAGTLDPLATGLLILCTGKMTKQIESYQAQEKEYTGTIVLGQTTPSYDLETEIDQINDISHLSAVEVNAITSKFIGWIDQVPPKFSAVKVDGKRAYKSARKGEDVVIKSRKVEIKEFELTRIEFPEVDFKVVCSKGTYIRSLAHDFGQELGVGAHLSALCRTRIGEFKLENAQTIEQIITKA